MLTINHSSDRIHEMPKRNTFCTGGRYNPREKDVICTHQQSEEPRSVDIMHGTLLNLGGARLSNGNRIDAGKLEEGWKLTWNFP